jgi:hypothetical protein
MLFNQTVDGRKVRQFSLSPVFLEPFAGKEPNWGPLGKFTFVRTYSRDLPEGGTEEFWQTCQRVVEGCFNIQKIHCNQMGLPWNEPKAQHSAQEMFQRMWAFKFSPPGRGLSVMGTDIVYQRGSAALLNCSFVSSDSIGEDFADPFCFLMDMSMLGVGVGADTRGAGKAKIVIPKTTTELFVVEDTREGWVDLIRDILNSFVGRGSYPLTIDYTKVRGRGLPLKTFGGTASGPKPLYDLVANLTRLLLPDAATVTFDAFTGDDWATIGVATATIVGVGAPYRITSTQIVDIFNFIGKAVVAGGLRRTAEIMFGDHDDMPFMTLKQDKEALNDRRWASNNSIFGHVGMDYSDVAKSLAVNGEPGIVWLDTARKFGRMKDPADNKDWRIMGTNPCFTGDTLIAVADGRGAVSIKQLVDEGCDVPVYSLDSQGMVEIQMARNPRMTYPGAPLVEVVLENGTSLRVTPDHKMVLLGGTICEAKELKPGDSLPRFAKYQESLKAGGPKYLRVKEVRFLDVTEPVYNLTVDKNHTVGIVTKFNDFECSGIFTHQCGEISLDSRESCNLVECYPAHHDSYEDFERTLKMAYLYAKTITLIPTHDMRANAVMMRNRRIGCSLSGIVQAIQKIGRRQFLNWCDNGYQYVQTLDRKYSDWLGIPLSIKTTTVKPSGSISLLCGATPGIHYPHSEYYIRHVRVQNQSPLCQVARDAGYQVFPDVYADNTSVVAFPVHEKHYIKGKADVSLWEQFVLVADLQHHWSDNLVSATVTFKKSEIPDIKSCLEAFETRLKGISMMPLLEEDHGYSYPPYQTITEAEYLAMTKDTRGMAFAVGAHDTDERFCDGDKCMLPIRSPA